MADGPLLVSLPTKDSRVLNPTGENNWAVSSIIRHDAVIQVHMWVIDRACLVKMAGSILGEFFFSACLWTKTESSTRKEKKRQYPAVLTKHLGQ